MIKKGLVSRLSLTQKTEGLFEFGFFSFRNEVLAPQTKKRKEKREKKKRKEGENTGGLLGYSH